MATSLSFVSSASASTSLTSSEKSKINPSQYLSTININSNKAEWIIFHQYCLTGEINLDMDVQPWILHTNQRKDFEYLLHRLLVEGIISTQLAEDWQEKRLVAEGLELKLLMEQMKSELKASKALAKTTAKEFMKFIQENLEYIDKDWFKLWFLKEEHTETKESKEEVQHQVDRILKNHSFALTYAIKMNVQESMIKCWLPRLTKLKSSIKTYYYFEHQWWDDDTCFRCIEIVVGCGLLSSDEAIKGKEERLAKKKKSADESKMRKEKDDLVRQELEAKEMHEKIARNIILGKKVNEVTVLELINILIEEMKFSQNNNYTKFPYISGNLYNTIPYNPYL